MDYQDNKYYLEIVVLTPNQDGMALSCALPFKHWNDTYKDWRRKPWQDSFLVNTERLPLWNPPEDLCVYHHDVTYAIKCFLLSRHKRWWNKVIKTVDDKGIYHIRCKLPRLSKQSNLRTYEVIAYITNFTLPEDLLPLGVCSNYRKQSPDR